MPFYRGVWFLLSCCVAMFVLCHFYAVCPQGLPGLPTLAALHSNQILAVKVCWLSQTAQADTMDDTHTEMYKQCICPLCLCSDRLGLNTIVSDKSIPTNLKILSLIMTLSPSSRVVIIMQCGDRNLCIHSRTTISFP